MAKFGATNSANPRSAASEPIGAGSQPVVPTTHGTLASSAPRTPSPPPAAAATARPPPPPRAPRRPRPPPAPGRAPGPPRPPRRARRARSSRGFGEPGVDALDRRKEPLLRRPDSSRRELL